MTAGGAVPAKGTKVCTGCGETLPLDGFARDQRKRDGRRARCKGCTAAYQAANRERIAERDAVRYAANREQRAEYRAANRERIAKRKAEWYAVNRERIAENRARYRAANRDKAAADRARYRARKNGADSAPYDRATIFERWNNACAYCDAPAEALDHVVPVSKGGPDAAHNLLPACTSCNSSKGAKSLADWALTFGADSATNNERA